jgi:hypothetical protein
MVGGMKKPERMKSPTTRSALLMCGAGLLIAFMGAAFGGPGDGSVKLGLAVAVAGFIAWQVIARRDPRRR